MSGPSAMCLSRVIFIVISSCLALFRIAHSQLISSINTSCGDLICPGGTVVYYCGVPLQGTESVVWRIIPECVSGERDIPFVFARDSQVEIMCNDRRLVQLGRIDRSNGTVISSLNITNIITAQTMIECLRDNGSVEESVGNRMVHTTAPVPNVTSIDATPDLVLITLDQLSLIENCTLIDYNVSSYAECGMCGSVIHNSISCTNAQVGAECIVTIETTLCRMLENVLPINVTRAFQSITTGSNTPLNMQGLLSGGAIAGIVIALIVVVIVIVIVVVIICMKRKLKIVLNVLKKRIFGHMESENELPVTGNREETDLSVRYTRKDNKVITPAQETSVQHTQESSPGFGVGSNSNLSVLGSGIENPKTVTPANLNPASSTFSTSKDGMNISTHVNIKHSQPTVSHERSLPLSQQIFPSTYGEQSIMQKETQSYHHQHSESYFTASEVRDMFNTLNEKIDKFKSEIGVLLSTIQEKDKEIEKLKTEVNTLKTESKDRTAEMERYHNDIQNLQDENKKQHDEIKKLQEKLLQQKDEESDMKQLRKDMDQLVEKDKEQERQIEALKAEVAMQKEKDKEQERQIEILKAKLTMQREKNEEEVSDNEHEETRSLLP